jgi:hypothetical protein
MMESRRIADVVPMIDLSRRLARPTVPILFRGSDQREVISHGRERSVLRQLLDGLLRTVRDPQQAPRESGSHPEGSWTIGNPDARHPYEVKPDHPAADIISGMVFHATLQTRTPLRILRRHGQVVPLGTPLPNDFESWMGVWIPQSKGWRELGLCIDELPEFDAASDAGPVKVSEYLPFLIELREAIEDASGGIDGRVKRLERVCAKPKFARFVSALGGAQFLRDCFFPSILSLIPGLPSNSQVELTRRGLFTIAALRAACDDTLLAVNGVGPAKLRALRHFCVGYNGNPELERSANLAV